MRKHFKTTFFCTISPFLKVCFHSLRKRIYFLSKILNYKSLQDIFSFWWWQNEYGKTYFYFTFLFLKNNKVISEHSEFLSSLFNIAYWFILYIWSHDVCKYVQYETHIALFSIDCFFSGHSSAQKNEYQSGVFSSNQLSVCYRHNLFYYTVVLQYWEGWKKRGKIHFLDFL